MRGLDKKIVYTFLFSLGFLMFIPNTVFAARLYFESNAGLHFSTETSWYVDLMLDPEGESINALSLDISFDDTLLNVVDIYQDDSIVTSWIDQPNSNGNHIILSGIMAGGFDGQINPIENTRGAGRVARFVFNPKKSGTGSLIFEEVFISRNDGVATELPVNALPFMFELSEEGILQQGLLVDRRQPELFKPVISRDDSLFSGRYFLVFETKDRGVGIHHYEVKEGSGGWVEATSPYEIKDQSLRKQLYVKAVDTFGNMRVVKTFDRGLPIQGVFWFVISTLFVLFIIRFSLKKLKNKVYFTNGHNS